MGTPQNTAKRVAGEDGRGRFLDWMPVVDRRMELSGIPTAVFEGGAGQPMVLLHSAGEFAALWLRVIPRLVRTHHVVAPDLPGHGATGAAKAEQVLDWLRELIDRTCSRPPVVIGHGLGGAIALRLASEQPDLFHRLVLVDSFGLSEFAPEPDFATALHEFSEQPTESTRDHLFAQCFTDLDRLRTQMGTQWAALAAYALDRAQAPGWGATVGSLIPHFAAPADLSGISVPTALIWGRDDRQVPLRTALAATALYGWPLRVIDNAGDDPPMEQPDAFLAALEDLS
jgi:pimeloyl-ACP methyl ester carboxylesterase